MSKSGLHCLRNLIVCAAFGGAAALQPSWAQENPAEPDPAAIQRIFDCLSIGLPGNWERAWILVTERSRSGGERNPDSNFRFSDSPVDLQGKPLVPCQSESSVRDVFGLNVDLMRQYRESRLVFYRDGRYELRFDNPR